MSYNFLFLLLLVMSTLLSKKKYKKQMLNMQLHQIFITVKVKVTRSCPTLCDPMDYTAHGILQARILEWVAFSFSLNYSSHVFFNGTLVLKGKLNFNVIFTEFMY